MGAEAIKYTSVFEALQAKHRNALDTLVCRALAEPYNFYRVDASIHPGMLLPQISGTDGAILKECQRQFRENGKYTAQTVAAALNGLIGGVDGNYLHRTMQDAEMDLPLAFEHFYEIHGQWVEEQIATEVLNWIHYNKTSEEIRILADKMRADMGVVSRQTGSDGKAEFEAELAAAIDNRYFEFPVKPHLSSMRKLIPHFEPGDYIVVAALTGIGKTYFGLNTIYHNALAGVPSCCINLENTPKNIMKRLWQMHSGNKFRRDLRGTDDEMRAYLQAWEKVKAMPVRSHNPGRSLPAILSTIRYEYNERGIQLAVVDYAQLINIPGYKGMRNYELGEISAELRSLALELQIPIMVLAQMKQEVVKTGDKRGGLYDIKDCANFAQDAPIVINLYRPFEVEVYNDERGEPYSEDYADATIVKGRETGRAMAKCRFDPVKGFYDKVQQFQTQAAPLDYSIPQSARDAARSEDLPF